MTICWFSIRISISNGFGCTLKNFGSFCHFKARNSNPSQTSDDLTAKTNKAYSCKISMKQVFRYLGCFTINIDRSSCSGLKMNVNGVAFLSSVAVIISQ